ncbi:MAG: hypothetical protein HOO67_00730 [Candidatus Peribacteraceae bacterium]|nr:hypothetical protein [Candidatus Peribacteraceae bacterium]
MHEFLTSLGSVSAVIGAQWGDEGKGKAIDILTEHFDVVARACGGANAGHTIVVNGKKHVFRLLPSGSLHSHVQVYLGSGMVIHLPTLLEELGLLKDAGIELLDRLHIAPNAHIVFEFTKPSTERWRTRKARMRSGRRAAASVRRTRTKRRARDCAWKRCRGRSKTFGHGSRRKQLPSKQCTA